MPPDQMSDMGSEKMMGTSVQRRGGEVIQPNSLKYAATLYPANAPFLSLYALAEASPQNSLQGLWSA